MARTFYKLLIAGLAFLTIVQAFSMTYEIYNYLDYSKFGSGPDLVSNFVLMAYVTSKFILFVCALYWIPKIIKKLFPEVA